ncbi:hypothetical protein BU26DRAFT_477187 [Trematosphaeria pertusa]|uniref:Uncharacterized protein n=1 Tax=Trematosphaeria pertusa TaxID=390896 RepID=A0A6A6IRZ2_9PLEO|nr:uncharacterized protein BU26DRAFT_477187 [Trematosphaeria pertusa]KAF2253176.1 hypothetical protein BU26DRAFT_477187 [Trematosphaeria pertusa]
MTAFDDYGMPVGAYSEPESLTHQAWRVARAFAVYRVKPAVEKRIRGLRQREWSWRRILSLVRVLVLVWWVMLYLGERRHFTKAVDECRWEKWETWDSNANPHRLVFVADPQLVDPHTYPGRPWPLNTLTVKFTDQYLRRTYSRVQKVLYPDSVVFLGDLFDGGREWSTRTTKSPEEQYRKYGDNFWLNEYNRFGGIFFGHWADGGLEPRPGQPGRKIISSLPGNHDLGFGKGIQASVRKRFNAYFGDGNRVDILGNHTFVSIDSVSLSALGQDSPQTVEELWRPTVDFLENAKKQKRRVVQRELRKQKGLHPYPGFEHKIVEGGDLANAQLPHSNDDVTEFPTILLTHVPLYRAPGTPCGPLREHWPPTPVGKGQEPLEKDDRNAIAVRGGYQYQNVLNREITADLTEKIGEIRYAFSGDDHDYCEVVHRGYASAGGGIREVTVKSLSWAMGVRHPGFVMLSMWNPVDELGNPISGDATSTLQAHLCLMPDQLGIFIRYASFFGVTFLALVIRAALVTAGKVKPATQFFESPLLPTSNEPLPAINASSAEHEKAELTSRPREDNYNPTHSSDSSTSSERANLQVRNAQARTRSVSPSSYCLPAQQSKYTYPLIQHAGYYGPSEEEEEERRQAQSRDWGNVNTKKTKPKRKGMALFWQELRNTIAAVAVQVFVWYFWLIWRW